MATAAHYQIVLGADGPAQLTFNQDSGRVIGFNYKRSGNKSTQAATITLNNEDGPVWNSELPPRSPVTISIEGVEAFNGFVDNLNVSDGNPGQLVVECIGRTAKLADSPVRPLIYGEGLSGDILATQRDFDALPVIVSGGKIEVPVGFKTSPIWQIGKISYNNGLETNSFGPVGVVFGTAGTTTTPSVFGSNFNSSRNQTLTSQGLSYGQLPTPATFTFEGFIKPSNVALGSQTIAGVRSATAPSWRVRIDGASTLLFEMWDSAGTIHTVTGPVLTDGTIYHIEANWRGGLSMNLIVNGAPMPATFPVTSIFPYQNPLVFGRSTSLDGFIGDMDEFRYSDGIARHSGAITVPTDPYTVDDFTVVLEHFDTVAEAQASGIHSGVILARSVDLTDNVILVDPKYNGVTAYLSYEVFRAKFKDTDAATIINELVGRHGTGGVQSAIADTGIDISFEPELGSDLYVEIGRIRDIIGPNYDFFLDANDVLQLALRSATSVRTIRGDECHSASFSTDYAAYANSVTARAGSGIENDIGPFPGYLENKLEDLQPTSPNNTVDALAQGFKALGNRLGSFSFRGKRQTEEDAIDFEVQYNGKRNAIPHVQPVSVYSLTPDSLNITIDHVTSNSDGSIGSYGVKLNSVAGTAYFSNSWTPELVAKQDASNANTAMGANTYQTITVADLVLKTIKGIAFSSNSTAGTVRFDIYSGTAGTAGTLLGTSEDVTLAASTDREMFLNWFSVYFATPVDVSAQTNISIVAVGSAGQNWARNTGGGYAGGQASSGAGDDFTFQIFTVTAIPSEAFAGVYNHNESIGNDIVTIPSTRTPQYYISSNYVIGLPAAATWTEVTVNTARIMSSVAPAGKDIGFKVAFTNSSQTNDPRILRVRESVAFENGETALTDPSGIVVGDIFDSVGVKAMPYFNPETGTQTEDIAVPDAGRLEIGANYWLVMRDGNVANTKSYFTAMYSDGASVIFENDWDFADYQALASRTFVTASSGGSNEFTPTGTLSRRGIHSNSPSAGPGQLSGSMGFAQSADSETSQAQITAGRFVATNTLGGGSILTLLSRNRRNYYFPGKSQTPGLPAVRTGEILIWQFDDADAGAPVTGFANVSKDKSGHGFDAGWSTVASTSTDGKFGQAFGNKGGGATSGIVTAINPNLSAKARLGQWLQEDITLGFWFKKTTVDASGCTIRLGSSTAAKFNFKIGFTAAGRLTYTHSNGQGAGSETLTSTNPVLVAATYKHLLLIMRRGTVANLDIYVDGTPVETLTSSTTPDRYGDEFKITLGPTSGAAAADIKIDEVRIWPFNPNRGTFASLLQLIQSLAITNPYDSGLTKLTFPAEADATDDYTTSDTADTVKQNLQFIEYLSPAPYQEDFVVLNLPFNQIGDSPNDLFYSDIGSFGQSVSSTSYPAVATGGTDGSLRSDFNGTANYLQVADSLFLHLGQRFAWTFQMQQDVTGATQVLLYKRGEFSLTAKATSSTTTDFLLTISHQGGVQFVPFSNVAVGTGAHDIAITMGLSSAGRLAVSLYVDTVTDAEAVAGESIAVSAVAVLDRPRNRSSYPMMIGCKSDQRDGSGRTGFFDGKLDAILWANVQLVNGFMDVDTDNSTQVPIEYTLRSPKQEHLLALGYSGIPVNQYPDGKCVVSRDNEDNWSQSLDGTTTDTFGALAFAMTFDKDDLQCNRRDLDEIARVGSVVEKVFDFPTQDAATLCTIAGGYLDLLKDGLEKGRISIDGTTDLDVGQVATINYPQKAQFFKEYGIAAIETTVSDGIYRTALQLGEEERGIASLFGTSEVGIK